MPFRPALAPSGGDQISGIRFPGYASYKLDGLRATVHPEGLMSRSMKPFTNKATHAFFSHPLLEGMDGELIVGDPSSKKAFLNSTGPLRNINGDPRAVFYVFDLFNEPKLPYHDRLSLLRTQVSNLIACAPEYEGRVVVIEQVWIESMDELKSYEELALALGFEGVMWRDPSAPYKQGRSTISEGYLLKVKRFADAEAEILGLIEGLKNTNEAKINELGFTERSTNKDGMVKTNTTGAFLMRDLKTGAIFTCGTGVGLDIASRAAWWARRDASAIHTMYLPLASGGQVRVDYYKLAEDLPVIGKYKHFPIGYEVLPRFPIFMGERMREDMDA